ncbi:MAG: type II secretion system protein [Candidatus Zambryskibacteria bacterium]|nr:type II secretion system protein [Candidatus Zambryskibacteria bacterium]
MPKINLHPGGFTLIELLVVIAIIGLLSSVVLASLNTARIKGRIAKRLSDMREIQKALELYYDANGSYPNPGWGWRSQCASWSGLASNNVIPGIVPTYMPSFPADPTMDISGSRACYLYLSNGADYALLDHDVPELEGGAAPNYASYPAFVDSSRPTWAWKISSPGGTNW